ncbi:hypothetical protein, partial [Pseudomonas aeruginosa]|uniref:hypothetical protein n=1 Tax=Pseudomonas aeruginosa TaxID=287 RepID=UPI000AC920D0
AADHWLRPFYDIGRAEGQRTQELAMLVRMLAASLKRHAPESNLVARATNYLAAKGLAGTPLRDPPAPVEQAGGDERVIGWRERILAAHPNSDPGFWPDALLVEHMAAEIADLRAALARAAELEKELAMTRDAASKGDAARHAAGGMEMEIQELKAKLAEQAQHSAPEVFGLERYRVERTGQGFWPYCVRAGDGTRELFVGHLKQCKRVAAQLATAFEDGKFIARLPTVQAQHNVPSGWKLVPLEPTPEMLDARRDSEDGMDGYLVEDTEYYFPDRGAVRDFLACVYRGLLAAAPAPGGEQ